MAEMLSWIGPDGFCTITHFQICRGLDRTVRSSSKASNPTFQPLIGSQEPTPEVLVPVINVTEAIRGSGRNEIFSPRDILHT